MILLALLLACPAPVPPPVYVVPVVRAEPPPAFVAPAIEGACPAAAAYLPGRPAPYSDGGSVSCRAVVVPPGVLAELEAGEADAAYWRRVYEVAVDARDAERAWCEEVAAHRYEVARIAEREARLARWGIVGGVVLGVAVGVAVGRVAR
jgi:hypothetical protein